MNKTLLLIICDFLLLNLIHFTAWDKLAEDSNNTPATGGPVASGTGMGDTSADLEYLMSKYKKEKADREDENIENAALRFEMNANRLQSATNLQAAVKNATGWFEAFKSSAETNKFLSAKTNKMSNAHVVALAEMERLRNMKSAVTDESEKYREELAVAKKANEALGEENKKNKAVADGLALTLGGVRIENAAAKKLAAAERAERIAAEKRAEAERKKAEEERNKAALASDARNKALLEKAKAEGERDTANKAAQDADARAIISNKVAQAARVEADNTKAEAAGRIKAADSRAADAKATSVKEIGAARAQAAAQIKGADNRAASAIATSVKETKVAQAEAAGRIKAAQIKADTRVAEVVKVANIRETAIKKDATKQINEVKTGAAKQVEQANIRATKQINDVKAVTIQRVEQANILAANSEKKMEIAVVKKEVAEAKLVVADKSLTVAKANIKQRETELISETKAKEEAIKVRDEALKRLAEKPIVAGKMAKHYYTNQVELVYEYTGFLGRTEKPKSPTVLAEMTIQGKPWVCAITHIRETPYKTWGRKKVSGSLGSKNGKKLLPIHSLRFLSADPRVNIIPVGLVGSASVRALGVKPYKLATDPFKFPTAFIMKKDGKKYAIFEFEYDRNNPDYVKVDNIFLNFGGKPNPSEGDLVFSRTGDLLGIMANNTYCLVIRNAKASAGIQFGKDDAKLEQILGDLKKNIKTKPRALQ